MNEIHLPWLELSILVPLIGGIWLSRAHRDPEEARRWSLAFTGVTFLCGLWAWFDFSYGVATGRGEGLLFLRRLLPSGCLAMDVLSAPLLPLAALLYMLVAIGTL